MAENTETARQPQDQYRSLLLQLPGVYAANVTMDGEHAVREVHIVAENSRNPKQINRDVQSALMAAFNVQVDHRVISIAQISPSAFEGSGQPAHNGGLLRLECAGVSISVEDDRFSVGVRLRHGPSETRGEALCRNTCVQRSRAVAQATLNAAHALLGGDELFNLVNTQSVTISGIPIAITLLEYSREKEERLLIGAARQSEDGSTGFVKSTLDALNRSVAIAHVANQ